MAIVSISAGDQETIIKKKAVDNFNELITDGSLTASDYELDLGGRGLVSFRKLCNANFDQFYADLITGAIFAQGTLTVDTLPTAGDTMTIGATEYTFVASGDFDTAGEIPITAGDLAATQASIVDAINGDDATNTANASVAAQSFTDDACILTAKVAGSAGNAVVTTETFTAETNVFDGDTLGETTEGFPCDITGMANYPSLNGGDSWYTIRTKLNTLFGMVDDTISSCL